MADLVRMAARTVLAAVVALTAFAVGGGVGLVVTFSTAAATGPASTVVLVWAVAAVLLAALAAYGLHIVHAPTHREVTR